MGDRKNRPYDHSKPQEYHEVPRISLSEFHRRERDFLVEQQRVMTQNSVAHRGYKKPGEVSGRDLLEDDQIT